MFALKKIRITKYNLNIQIRALSKLLYRVEQKKNKKIQSKLSKYLKEGIFELRVKHKTRISRSLYFFPKDGFIYFLFGFIKKTEKTPNEVIYRAIKMKNNK